MAPPQTERCPRITAIATALPGCEVHHSYNAWALRQLKGSRKAAIFERMMERSGIAQRFSVLPQGDGQLSFGSFYNAGASPSTAARMARYCESAPELALEAISRLPALDGITHMVTASCTGFMAPGLDQVVARRLGLAPTVERIFLGFMGCYAGVTALRTAGMIVRADPQARVLVLSVELCTLHMQDTDDLEQLLAMGQFADGAGAAIVSGEGAGLALGKALSLTLNDAADLITWDVGNTGFAMHLSGAVPARLAEQLDDPATLAQITGGTDGDEIVSWAIHPGGRSILDAVERGLALPDGALAASREVLRSAGNMSSASIMFVLERLMGEQPGHGLALAFGPGLGVEGLHYQWTGDAG